MHGVRGGSLRFRKWNYFSQKVHRFPDRGREIAITQLKRQHGKVHFTIKCCVVARVFINHTHKVGKKMFPFKLLEVYYIKNKKFGKRSENIMIQKLNTARGTRSRVYSMRALMRHHQTIKTLTLASGFLTIILYSTECYGHVLCLPSSIIIVC